MLSRRPVLIGDYVPLQWPAALRPLTQLAELPAQVLERYNAVQTVCFCGVFPQIRRAWASVDNTLFLWRLDRWCPPPPPSGLNFAVRCLVRM